MLYQWNASYERIDPMTIALPKEILENDTKDGWPSIVDMKVIVPGLVRYEDLRNSAGQMVTGDVLVKKEVLDRMAASIEGKPIVNWDHRTVSPKDFGKGRAQGIIVGPALFNAADGWYHAKGLVWDEQTKRNIENGFSISCAYTVNEWGDGPGTYNKVPYEREVLNGAYTHIAVVSNPRYEEARIELLNSEGGNTMSLLSFFKKDKPEEKIEFDAAKAVVSVDGKDVPLSELMNSFKAVEAAKEHRPGLEDVIDIDGKKVPVAELLNAHKALNAAKETRELENSHKAGDHKTVLTNCVMCNTAAEDEKEKKEADERKNAAEAEEAKKKKDEELKNSADKEKAEAAKRAAELEELRNKGGKVTMPTIKTMKDRMEDGESRYGKAPVVVAGK